MLLIYTQKVTPRIVYVFKHIFTNILGVSIKFTSKIEEFIAYDGVKLSYGKQGLGNEFFIQKAGLLMEQGFSEVEIKVQPWDDTVCFFAVTDSSDIPFDIFAASFFLLTRYEEYLPHVKDDEGRFPPGESLASQEDFLLKPVVDIWAYKFKEILLERFSSLSFKKRNFETGSLIAVEHVFNYKNKGFLRTLVGIHLDMIRLNFGKLSDRLQVLFKLKKDPFDIFDDLIQLIKEHKFTMFFMFQLSDFSVYDRNIGHNRIPYRAVIKSIADYAKVGLLLGHYAMDDIKILRKEKLRMEDIIHSPLENVANSKFNLNLPDTYNNLIELEINTDHSMGYPNALGFRAGTCTPYLFYDINMEVTTPLSINPYAFHSNVVELLSKTKITEQLDKMLQEVRDVNGTFKGLFKNQDFSDYSEKQVYYTFLKKIHEIE